MQCAVGGACSGRAVEGRKGGDFLLGAACILKWSACGAERGGQAWAAHTKAQGACRGYTFLPCITCWHT